MICRTKRKASLIALAVSTVFAGSASAEYIYLDDGQTHNYADPVFSVSQSIGEGQGGSAVNLRSSNSTIVNVTSKTISSSLTVNRNWTENNTYYTFTGATASSLNGQNGGTLNLGDTETETISINVNVVGTGKDSAGNTVGLDAIGLWAHRQYAASQTNSGGQINVKGQTLNINVHSESGGAYGIWTQNSSTQTSAAPASVIIDAENTIINVTNGGHGDSTGIVAMSQGIVKINGNLTVNAKDAIIARGHASVGINEANRSDVTVVLNGDINFNYDKDTSGTTADADVVVNLTNAASSWTGSALYSYGTGAEEPPSTITGLDLGLANGAQWTPAYTADTTGEGQDSGEKPVSINQLAFNDGVINLTDAALVENGQNIMVDTLTGTGGTLNVATTIADGSVSTAKLQVANLGTAEEPASPSFNIVAAGVTADDITAENQSQVLDALAASLVGKDGETAVAADRTSKIAEGDIKGAITQTVDADGTVGEAVQSTNTKLDAYGSTLSLGTFLWRHDMNDLTKRMGELRDSPEGVGSWVRLYGSEQEYNALIAKNTTVQVGADVDVGHGWKVGGAFSYTDGDADEDNASSESDMYGLAVYGSWFGENGLFVDMIAKYSRMSTDFTASTMTGSYDNNALSASVEAGWHLPLQNVAFVEPQVELTYGRIMGDDFTASNGVKVEQEDTDSFIGRAGLRAGFYFPEKKGTVYARASVLHDFDGEVESRASKNGVSERIYDDLGGTWCEFAVGANFNVTERTYTYVDLERTTGGEVEENWRWNVGLRHVF